MKLSTQLAATLRPGQEALPPPALILTLFQAEVAGFTGEPVGVIP